MILTADMVAHAIVAAARETREHPLTAYREAYQTVRSRHYALHALHHCCPEVPVNRLALMLGAGGKANRFYANSIVTVVRRAGTASGWWDENAYTRVIAAIEAVMPAPGPTQVDSREEPPRSTPAQIPPPPKAKQIIQRLIPAQAGERPAARLKHHLL